MLAVPEAEVPPTRASAPPFRRWVWRVVAVLIGAYLLARLCRVVAGLVLDKWWFSSVGYGEVFSTVTWSRIGLGAFGALWIAVAVGTQLWWARRNGGPIDRNIPAAWWHEKMGRAEPFAAVAVVVWLAWSKGLPFSRYWSLWVQFRNSTPAGRTDPIFHRDVSLYLFHLPFLTVLFGILLYGALAGLGLSAAMYTLNGGLRVEGVIPRGMRRTAYRHLLVSAGVVGLLFAAKLFWVDRLRLSVSSSGTFSGAGYVDDHVRSPGYVVAAVILVVAAVLCVAAGIRRRWGALGKVVVGASLAGAVAAVGLPTVTQLLVVNPAAARKERKYVAANRDATIFAYGLDASSQRDVDVSTGPAVPATATLQGTPLLDPVVTQQTLQTLDGRQNLVIGPVTTDRYTIASTTRLVSLAPQLPDRATASGSWENSHLVYTHGQGIEAVYADSADATGRPIAVSTSSGELELKQPAFYYGPGFDGWYAVVHTGRAQFADARYPGNGEVELGSGLRRFVAGLALREPSFVLSSYLTKKSTLLMRRGVTERLNAVAPFLTLADPPQPVITGGKLVWIADLATTSSRYPSAQFTRFAAADGTANPVNYLKASVKATIEADTGKVRLYRLDDTQAREDPVLDVWAKAFPHLLSPKDAMPMALREHLLYPANVFRVQASLVGTYRVQNPDRLSDSSLAWAVAPDVGKTVAASAKGPMAPVMTFTSADGDRNLERLLPLVSGANGGQRPRMTGVVSVGQSLDDYGKIRLTAFTGAHEVDSPVAIQRTIESDTRISWILTQLNQSGSKVSFGPMVVGTPPIGGSAPKAKDDTVSVIAVRGVYIAGSGSDSFARLLSVAVVHDGKAVLAPDVQTGLRALDDPALADKLARDLLPVVSSGAGAGTASGGN